MKRILIVEDDTTLNKMLSIDYEGGAMLRCVSQIAAFSCGVRMGV